MPGVRVADDLLDRGFAAGAPDRCWVADITYLPTWEGWLYLVAVQDLYSRRIVGWSMADHMRTELVTDALQMALARRRPARGLIWHCDQGSQFVSLAFGQQARAAGIAQSMGSRGDCYDNAVAKSFFATLKKELIHRHTWATKAELRLEVFDYIEVFYKPPAPPLHPGPALPGRLRSPDSEPVGFGSRRFAARISLSDHVHYKLTSGQGCVINPVHRTGGTPDHGYDDVGRHRFSHVVVNVKASGDPAHVAMPRVHRVASLLKRWLLGTHQGAVTHGQLDFYLDEFTFRFNRRGSRHRGLLFYRLIEGALTADPHPYATLLTPRTAP